MKKFSFALAATMFALSCAPQAGAISLEFAPGVTGTASSYTSFCYLPYTSNVYEGCSTNAFVSDSLATSADVFMNLDTFGGGGQGLGTETFASAFANTLPGWTLASGDLSALSGITLTVSSFSTGSYQPNGGISRADEDHNITVLVSGVDTLAGNLADQLVWIQGLEINYTPGGDPANFLTTNNYNTLDDSTFNGFPYCTPIPAGSPSEPQGSGPNGYCDPIYPFQYSNMQFYDAPRGPWPYGSFRGIALLATIDPEAQLVTTYAGVSYGFDNTVAPEPGTWVLLLAGVGGIFFGRRRAMARG
jgi:hypothetical protein